jgi:hypothetical protein
MQRIWNQMPVPQRVALKDCDRLSRYSIFSTRQKCHETGNKRDETRISRRVFRCKHRLLINKRRDIRVTRHDIRVSSVQIPRSREGWVGSRREPTASRLPRRARARRAARETPWVGTARCAVRSSQRDDPTLEISRPARTLKASPFAPARGGCLTATTRQHLDDDVLQVRITMLAVKFPPERGVGKVFAGETGKALVPSRGQRAGMSSHSLFLGGPCHDVPVPELVKESRQGFHGRFTLNGRHATLLRAGSC